MAFTNPLADYGDTNQPYKPPLTYDGAGSTPGAIGGNIAPPVFNPGPSLPHISGATVTGGPLANPFPAPRVGPAPAAPNLPPLSAPTGGGGQPNIDQFPGVSNTLALEQQGLAQLDARLNAARQQMIINYGDPALASMAGFGLDPQAGAFAQQNYLSGNSTKSRTDKEHQLRARAIVNQLAGHGILNSGDLGYLSGEENQAYGNATYDAQQAVLKQLNDLYDSYTGNRHQLEQGVNDARLQALQAYLQNPDAYASLFGGSPPGTQGAPPPKLGGEGGLNPNGTRNIGATYTPPKKSKAAPDALSRYLSAR